MSEVVFPILHRSDFHFSNFHYPEKLLCVTVLSCCSWLILPLIEDLTQVSKSECMSRETLNVWCLDVLDLIFSSTLFNHFISNYLNSVLNMVRAFSFLQFFFSLSLLWKKAVYRGRLNFTFAKMEVFTASSAICIFCAQSE